MAEVYYQEKDLTIQIFSDEKKKDWLYEVDLEMCIDAAQLLDYIFQIASKTWCSPEILSDLIKEIEKACKHKHKENAQAVFCPFGKYKTIKWN